MGAFAFAGPGVFMSVFQAGDALANEGYPCRPDGWLRSVAVFRYNGLVQMCRGLPLRIRSTEAVLPVAALTRQTARHDEDRREVG